MEPIAVGIAGAAEMLSVGKTFVYELLGRGELRARKVGRRLLVETSSIRDFVGRQPVAEIRLPARERRKLAAEAFRPPRA